ncbi:hypothetical protein predicted by Glimmer/Critica [Bdellovibrio bacteriovorus HD100]|uniref:Uncharacterized protein n=1 Tax=Bdellovibrio bacteriovorus (strain ATCC 15356 / DSM 50701 / NCIMB 9529 / HD100) TaxID=264462 RepID=Q6MIU7_BDEBA|nr:hypothetical protein predicted by Glimmer/Critica [Bdellovibrio bacteriovorus HD100]
MLASAKPTFALPALTSESVLIMAFLFLGFNPRFAQSAFRALPFCSCALRVNNLLFYFSFILEGPPFGSARE